MITILDGDEWQPWVIDEPSEQPEWRFQLTHNSQDGNWFVGETVLLEPVELLPLV
jgi:hypothetical protein